MTAHDAAVLAHRVLEACYELGYSAHDDFLYDEELIDALVAEIVAWLGEHGISMEEGQGEATRARPR